MSEDSSVDTADVEQRMEDGEAVSSSADGSFADNSINKLKDTSMEELALSTTTDDDEGKEEEAAPLENGGGHHDGDAVDNGHGGHEEEVVKEVDGDDLGPEQQVEVEEKEEAAAVEEEEDANEAGEQENTTADKEEADERAGSESPQMLTPPKKKAPEEVDLDKEEDEEDKKASAEKEPSAPREKPVYETDPTDEEWFSSLAEEELEWYADLGPKPEDLQGKLFSCTACSKQMQQLTGALGPHRHPLLGVAVCRACRIFYGDGKWETDADGDDCYCRWCANGGDLACCEKCAKAFCKRCLQRNMGRKFMSDLKKADEWNCLACDPKQIYKLRAEYYVFSKFLRNQQTPVKRAGGGRGSGGESGKKLSAPASADNFIDENIQAAFKNLSTYQKALDVQRKAWAKHRKDAMTADNAATVGKNLRRIFSKIRKNMELLDDALVENFEEKFPDDKKKIKVAGTAGPVKRKLSMSPTKASGGGGPSRKRIRKSGGGGVTPVSAAKNARAKPKKAKRSQEVVELNGDTSDEEDDASPSSSAARKRPGSAQGKVSMSSLFGKKKKTTTGVSVTKVVDSDSDIDLVPASKTPSPKKSPPKKPGPASSKKPGPASSKKPGPASSKKPGPASSKKPGPASSKKPGPASSKKPGPASSKKPGPKSRTA